MTREVVRITTLRTTAETVERKTFSLKESFQGKNSVSFRQRRWTRQENGRQNLQGSIKTSPLHRQFHSTYTSRVQSLNISTPPLKGSDFVPRYLYGFHPTPVSSLVTGMSRELSAGPDSKQISCATRLRPPLCSDRSHWERRPIACLFTTRVWIA